MEVLRRDRLPWNQLGRWPWGAIVALALVAISAWRITDTYRTFNHTFDEASHIAAGMEWLDAGTYNYETQHPPMRAVLAVGPRLLGRQHYGEPSLVLEGQRILYGDGRYWQNLTAARIAVLPFFLFTLLLVFIWAKRLAGTAGGLLAPLVYSSLPVALAHAGLATTDTLLVAPFIATLFIWTRWLERPTRTRAVALGMAGAVATLSKLSSIPFLGIVLGVSGLLWLLRQPQRSDGPAPAIRDRLRTASVSAGCALLAWFVVLWAGYRFSFGAISSPEDAQRAVDNFVGDGAARHFAYQLLTLHVPAWEFFNGIGQLLNHMVSGHRSFFMGSAYDHGHWAFFPVAIAIKTPIPALILMAVGIVLLLGRGWRDREPAALVPPLAAIAIVLSCVPSSINIGLRHVLPIFPLLAICAGVAGTALWTSQSWRAATRSVLIGLLAWHLAAGARAHPDYLAYFNECCDSSPQSWLLDSDLDWGQDLHRLSIELRRRNIAFVHTAYFGTAELSRHGLPAFAPLPRNEQVRGWVAISEMALARSEGEYAWLNRYEPVARVGQSIRLYRIP